MTAALILLSIIIGAGLVLYIHHRLTTPASEPAAVAPTANDSQEEEECCGRHAVCERDSLLAGIDREVLYYDDEELDAYRGRAAEHYTPRESEQFRDILLSMRRDEIPAWARSLTMRGIQLPTDVRDELLLIVSETRNNGTL